jgi:hypothetical protein
VRGEGTAGRAVHGRHEKGGTGRRKKAPGQRKLSKEAAIKRGESRGLMMAVWNPRRIQGAVDGGGRQWRWRWTAKSKRKIIIKLN